MLYDQTPIDGYLKVRQTSLMGEGLVRRGHVVDEGASGGAGEEKAA